MTLRGAECIRMADVIIYDHLASNEVLEWAPRGCEMIYVGKRGGKRSAATQDEINDMLLRKSAEGKKVVRLKGGDPFVFGRGGEEAGVLAANGVPFEVVPGVTSAVAAPGFAGIPLTHRSLSSSFCVVTGHEDPEKNSSSVSWETLARSGSTLVFLMGVRRLPFITSNLLKVGMDGSTPSALVRWGSTPRQRTLVAPLADIARAASEADFKPPAVLVVGSVVRLRDSLCWFERRPLFGMTVLVTRAKGQAGRLRAALRAQGAGTVELPVIAFAAPEDKEPLDRAIRGLGEYDWLAFTSANGVSWFLKRVHELGGDVRTLAGPRVVAVGPATRSALEARGIKVEGTPSKYVAEELVEYLSGEQIVGARILVVRPEEARPALVPGLERLGASVDQAVCYRTVAAETDPAEAAELLRSGAVDMLTFTSSSTVTCALNLLEKAVDRRAIERVPAACIGPVTAKTAQDAGLNVSVVAGDYTIDGLVDAIVAHRASSG